MSQSFIINIQQDILDDLNDRIAATRWTDEVDNSKWEAGTSMAYLKELTSYWQQDFDWKKQETWLNSFTHYKTTIDDT